MTLSFLANVYHSKSCLAAEEEVALAVGADPASAVALMQRMTHPANPAAVPPQNAPPPPLPEGPNSRKPDDPAPAPPPAKKQRKEKPAVPWRQ